MTIFSTNNLVMILFQELQCICIFFFSFHDKLLFTFHLLLVVKNTQEWKITENESK